METNTFVHFLFAFSCAAACISSRAQCAHHRLQFLVQRQDVRGQFHEEIVDGRETHHNHADFGRIEHVAQLEQWRSGRIEEIVQIAQRRHEKIRSNQVRDVGLQDDGQWTDYVDDIRDQSHKAEGVQRPIEQPFFVGKMRKAVLLDFCKVSINEYAQIWPE